MYKLLIILVSLILLFEPSLQDVYLHNPRGSNNRLNENTANRNNNNRIFDSQNNAKGGYNVGDATSKAFTTENEQYQMRYFQSGVLGSSYLNIEWTQQHGCGGSGVTNEINTQCLTVLQYMCQSSTELSDGDDFKNLDRLRDGITRDTQGYGNMGADTLATRISRKNTSVKFERGLHESWENYDSCRYRERNGGLFTADQALQNNDKGYSSAIYTRQNANGGRSGYECAEERDYYPYWHPSSWKDIAVITNDNSRCSYYTSESFNVKPKGLCVEFYADKTQKHWSRWNNPKDCAANNGTWTEFYNYLEKAPEFQTQAACEANKGFKWALPIGSENINQKECLVLLTAPICKVSDFTRQNHLGNTKLGQASSFQWKLPYFPSQKLQKCVFRLRYNITNGDFDQLTANSDLNGDKSPVKNNPEVKVGPQTLKLAINTAQTGRVFQDRSHVFLLMGRKNNIDDSAVIHNLNVRGKRGNIVETYPAVEYDFIPNNLKLNQNEFVHIQWTGSNTHNNNAQGNAGQGQDGTDRSNLVMINEITKLYPIQFEQSSFWQDINFIGYLNGQNLLGDDTTKYVQKLGNSADLKKDLSLYLSSSSYYRCIATSTCAESFAAKQELDSDLNNAPASLPGALIQFTKSNSTYNYMCSRNNAFSNRNQVGFFKVN